MCFESIAEPKNLFRQAPFTAEEYMLDAIKAIDNRFGKGAAQKHPELIGAFMKTAASDFNTMMMYKALEQVSLALSEVAIANNNLFTVEE